MLINPINYALLDGIACILAVIMFPLNCDLISNIVYMIKVIATD